MSWAEIIKINDNLNKPLNRQLEASLRHQFYAVQSCSFVVPRTGLYRVTCIGAGADGTKGGDTNSPGGTSGSPTYGPAEDGNGGGGGGACQSILELTAGDTIEITVNAALSSFGSFLTAYAGSGMSGGTASGGTEFNLTGADAVGKAGGNCALVTGLSYSGLGGAGATYGNPGGPGGKGYCPYPLLSLNSVSPPDGIYAGSGGAGQELSSGENGSIDGLPGGICLAFQESIAGRGGQGGGGSRLKSASSYGSGGGGGGGGSFFGGGGGGGGGGAVKGQGNRWGYGGQGGKGGLGVVIIEYCLL